MTGTVAEQSEFYSDVVNLVSSFVSTRLRKLSDSNPVMLSSVNLSKVTYLEDTRGELLANKIA